MTRSIWFAALPWALAAAALIGTPLGLADVADPGPDEELSATDAGVFDDSEDDAERDPVVGEDWSYAGTEFAAFEDDDLVEDDYGYFDSDFDWDVVDEDWDSWFEADTEAWEDDDDEDGFWDW